MLAVVTAAGARLDVGSVGLALSRRCSEAGDRVLFVDADASGSRLAERFGEAVRADYSPARRGLPSLIVAREQLTLRLLADHCYSLDTSDGSLWALFAPLHPAGARQAAQWLGRRAGDLMAVHRERSVIVSASLRSGGEGLEPLLRAAPAMVVISPVESAEHARALGTMFRGGGPAGPGRAYRVLVVEGPSPLGDEEICAVSGLPVAGRLPVLDDDRVLRLQGARKDRAFAWALDKIAGRVSALLSLDEAAAPDGLPPDARVAAPDGLPPDVRVAAPDGLPPDVRVAAPDGLPPDVRVAAPDGLPPDVRVAASDGLPPDVRVAAPDGRPPDVRVAASDGLPPDVRVAAPDGRPPDARVAAPGLGALEAPPGWSEANGGPAAPPGRAERAPGAGRQGRV